MRMLIISFLGLAILFLAIITAMDKGEDDNNRGPSNQIELQPMNRKIVHNYFVKDKKDLLDSCAAFEQKILDKEEGYQLERYPHAFPTRVYTDYDYKWSHDDEFLTVNAFCDFTVNFYVSPFVAGTDKLEIHLGIFKLKKYYNMETGKIRYLEFMD